MSGSIFVTRRAPLLALAAMLSGCVGTAQIISPRTYSVASDVLFDFGQARLKPQASDALRAILSQIVATFPRPYIRVIGHTDSIGSDVANDALSLRRAEAVQAWLMQAGVPAAVITTEGMGRRQPVAPNTYPDGRDNPEGRARNRRVELIASNVP